MTFQKSEQVYAVSSPPTSRLGTNFPLFPACLNNQSARLIPFVRAEPPKLKPTPPRVGFEPALILAGRPPLLRSDNGMCQLRGQLSTRSGCRTMSPSFRVNSPSRNSSFVLFGACPLFSMHILSQLPPECAGRDCLVRVL